MNNTKEIGRFAALLSLIEVGLGSFLHSFSAPFTGQILSLNQSFILTRASIKVKDKSSAAIISNTSALLKSLSPAGKKLTPMLAISAQGNLYSVGLYILGNNVLGRLLGTFLLCLWAYIQPLVIYLLLFGKDLIFMSEYFLKKISKVFDITQDQILTYILLIISFKILIGFILTLIAHRVSDKHFLAYENWAKRQKPKNEKKAVISPLKGAIKDLLNPLFIVSMILMGLFFFFSKTDISKAIWLLLAYLKKGFSETFDVF